MTIPSSAKTSNILNCPPLAVKKNGGRILWQPFDFMQPITPNHQYLRAKDVALAFGVSENTVWAWAKRGIIPRYRIGRCTVFLWDDINKTLCRNRYVGKNRCPVASLNVSNDTCPVERQS